MEYLNSFFVTMDNLQKSALLMAFKKINGSLLNLFANFLGHKGRGHCSFDR